MNETPETQAPRPADSQQQLSAAQIESIIARGWRTTEFWVAVAIALAAFGEQIVGALPANEAIIVAAASAAVFKICRTILKARLVSSVVRGENPAPRIEPNVSPNGNEEVHP